ncbi:MAG: hypothetical protein AB7P16_25005 [Bradyrhizobium sp.]|uniref:hypothetical protein n=1 Tax=Bradyrhizobium sp. TaxID=376 RepID=UPI003D0D7B3D
MRKADVVAWYGSAQLAAIALDMSRQRWYVLPDPLPKAHACELEVITAGGLRVDWSLYPRRRPIPDVMPKPRVP